MFSSLFSPVVLASLASLLSLTIASTNIDTEYDCAWTPTSRWSNSDCIMAVGSLVFSTTDPTTTLSVINYPYTFGGYGSCGLVLIIPEGSYNGSSASDLLLRFVDLIAGCPANKFPGQGSAFIWDDTTAIGADSESTYLLASLERIITDAVTDELDTDDDDSSSPVSYTLPAPDRLSRPASDLVARATPSTSNTTIATYMIGNATYSLLRTGAAIPDYPPPASLPIVQTHTFNHFNAALAKTVNLDTQDAIFGKGLALSSTPPKYSEAAAILAWASTDWADSWVDMYSKIGDVKGKKMKKVVADLQNDIETITGEAVGAWYVLVEQATGVTVVDFFWLDVVGSVAAFT